jgi:hypothetical protein
LVLTPHEVVCRVLVQPGNQRDRVIKQRGPGTPRGSVHGLMRRLGTPLGYRSYVFLLAANIGAVITQAIMIVVIITFAATIYTAGLHKPFGTVGQLAAALSSSIGPMNSKLLLGAAILRGALVAAPVVSLAAAPRNSANAIPNLGR